MVGTGKDSGFNYNNAFMLSASVTCKDVIFNYGNARLVQEALDDWLAQKLVFGGLKYDDSASTLTDAELKAIPHSGVIESMNFLSLEVCVVERGSVIIHPDEDKYWMSQIPAFKDEYLILKKNHEENFKHHLMSLAPQAAAGLHSREVVVVVVVISSKTKKLTYGL